MKKICAMILLSLTFSAQAQMSKENEEKAVEQMKEAARCAAFGNIYAANGGTMTDGNRRFYTASAVFDEYLQGAFKDVQQCRSSDPNSAALHQKCAESLTKYKKVLYESFVKGSQMMNQAYATNDKAKIGTYMLSCSK